MNLPGIFILVFVFVLFLPAIMIFIKFRKFFIRNNNKNFLKDKVVVPQYQPPDGLTAAELGVLADQKGGRLEFLATIYQLKTQKIISLSRDVNETVTIKLLKYPSDQLNSYEDLLVRYFFHENNEAILDSFFARTDFIMAQSYFQYLVSQTLQKKGLLFIAEGYEMQPYADYLEKVIQDPFKHILDYAKNGISKNLTAKAIEIYPNLEGFKQYIETAELDKIKFHAAGNLEAYIELLTPYAIALNQMERWRIVGIPLFLFKSAQLDGAAYSPNASDPTAFYQELIVIVKQMDAYNPPQIVAV